MKKILVVTPKGLIRDLLYRELTDEGYEVLLAATGERAAERCREERPDLVFVDTVLSGMENAEALKPFRSGYPPVLVWASYNPHCDESPWWAPEAHFLRTTSFVKVKEKIKELCSERGLTPA